MDRSALDRSALETDQLENIQAVMNPDGITISLIDMGGANGKRPVKIKSQIKLINQDASIL